MEFADMLNTNIIFCDFAPFVAKKFKSIIKLMTKQIVFAFALLVTLGVFLYTIRRIIKFFRFTGLLSRLKTLGKGLM